MTETYTSRGASLTGRALRSLRARFAGEIITPEDDAYGDARRVWNGMIDRYPAVIARCTNARDVALAIGFAREHVAPLAVRGGGHNAAGFGVCDGGVVIDLSPIRSVHVDPIGRRAQAGGGATWADVDGITQRHGLAVTGGLVTHTGIGGLTLGGGIGHLMRRCGLTCDNLMRAELVRADGAMLNVSPQENADLLWGLRGGGGNFGVVTQFEYQLHEIGPTVLAGALMYPMAAGAEVLRFYRDWAPQLPEEMTTAVALRTAPAAPFIPADLQGQSIIAVVVCWSGAVDTGQAVLEPLRRFKRPLVDLVAPKPYLEHQHMFDATAPHGRQNYKRNANLAALPDGVVDVLMEYSGRRTSPHSLIMVFQLGGAISRVSEDATAYSDRGALFNVDLNAQWLDPADTRTDEHIRWVRDFHAALQPFATGRAYVNFLMGDEGQDRVRTTYGAAKYERLVALKRRYDPANVFRLNQNIVP
ncbi:MAG TPA: FAD-binding oxidoreductase [Chloroflexota bacterium]|nr:FAD-binding oxidoreductase [Chloroflexota bacterium]